MVKEQDRARWEGKLYVKKEKTLTKDEGYVSANLKGKTKTSDTEVSTHRTQKVSRKKLGSSFQEKAHLEVGKTQPKSTRTQRIDQQR